MDETKKQTKYYINAALYFAIIILFFLLPPVAPLTDIGMKVFGIFIATVYGWSTCGLVWPSITSLFALTLSGYSDLKSLMTEGFGHEITLFTFFMFIIIGIINESGLNNYIANKILKLKISNGRPWVLFFVFICASYLVGTFAALGATLVCWSIFFNIAEEVGYTKKDKFPKIVIFGIAFSSTIAQALPPFQIGPILFWGMLEDFMGIQMNVGKYMLITFIFHVIVIGIYFLFCKFVLRPDSTRLKTFNVDLLPNLTLDPYQKRVGILFICFIIVLLLPNFMPASWKITQILTGFGSAGICAGFVALAVAMRFNRKPFIEIGETIFHGVQWNVVFLFSCVFPLSTALTSDSTGVKVFLNSILEPLLTGKGAFVFSIIILLFALIVTNFTINIVTGLMVMPIIASMADAVGANPVVITALLITVIMMAFLTPAASPAGAITYGNTKWVTSKEVLGFAIQVIVITFIGIVICIPLGNLIF